MRNQITQTSSAEALDIGAIKNVQMMMQQLNATQPSSTTTLPPTTTTTTTTLKHIIQIHDSIQSSSAKTKITNQPLTTHFIEYENKIYKLKTSSEDFLKQDSIVVDTNDATSKVGNGEILWPNQQQLLKNKNVPMVRAKKGEHDDVVVVSGHTRKTNGGSKIETIKVSSTTNNVTSIHKNVANITNNIKRITNNDNDFDDDDDNDDDKDSTNINHSTIINTYVITNTNTNENRIMNFNKHQKQKPRQTSSSSKSNNGKMNFDEKLSFIDDGLNGIETVIMSDGTTSNVLKTGTDVEHHHQHSNHIKYNPREYNVMEEQQEDDIITSSSRKSLQTSSLNENLYTPFYKSKSYNSDRINRIPVSLNYISSQGNSNNNKRINRIDCNTPLTHFPELTDNFNFPSIDRRRLHKQLVQSNYDSANVGYTNKEGGDGGGDVNSHEIRKCINGVWNRHVPPDPILQIILSHYGKYYPYPNIWAVRGNGWYSYAAGNDLHNNLPNGNYKIEGDFDNN